MNKCAVLFLLVSKTSLLKTVKGVLLFSLLLSSWCNRSKIRLDCWLLGLGLNSCEEEEQEELELVVSLAFCLAISITLLLMGLWFSPGVYSLASFTQALISSSVASGWSRTQELSFCCESRGNVRLRLPQSCLAFLARSL